MVIKHVSEFGAGRQSLPRKAKLQLAQARINPHQDRFDRNGIKAKWCGLKSQWQLYSDTVRKTTPSILSSKIHTKMVALLSQFLPRSWPNMAKPSN